jgi:hypothetical protein
MTLRQVDNGPLARNSTLNAIFSRRRRPWYETSLNPTDEDTNGVPPDDAPPERQDEDEDPDGMA